MLAPFRHPTRFAWLRDDVGPALGLTALLIKIGMHLQSTKALRDQLDLQSSRESKDWRASARDGETALEA